MKYSCLIFPVIYIITGCGNDEVEKISAPACIIERIDSIQKEKVWNPPAKIFSYTYNGATVYYIPPHCCDIPSILLDENCNPLCNPDGGITGTGSGTCTDFFEKRSNEKLVWSDDRK